MLICKPGQTNPSAERHQRPPPIYTEHFDH
jgi:hypothetical protein